jgi:environmental stress-induced protein Ves
VREVVHLTAADARRVPWRNGRGVTHELALWPEHARFEELDFEWRISSSAVDADGPFSKFAGFERVLVVTTGEGLILHHGDRAHRARLRTLEPYRFSGDWPTEAELSRGRVDDFNVLYRRARWRADVQAIRLGRRRARETIGARHAFVHVVSGSAVARVTAEEESFQLSEGDSVWVRDAAATDEIDLNGTSDAGVVLVVRLDAADDDRRS